MSEPSGWWTGQRIGGWAVGVTTLAPCIAANVTLFGLVYSMLLDEKGHWRSTASAMASVLQMEELS